MKIKLYFKIYLIFALILLIIINTYLVFQIKSIKHLPNRPVTVHTTGGTYIDDKVINGYEINVQNTEPKLTESNTVIERFTIKLYDKVKDSKVYFRYRIKGDNGLIADWQLVEPNNTGPLEYEVNLNLSLKKQQIEYHVIQEVNNEVIKAGKVQSKNIEYYFGDATLYTYKDHNSNKVMFKLIQERTNFKDFEIIRVIFSIKRGDKIENIVIDDDGPYREFPYEDNDITKIDSIIVKAIYADGVEKVEELSPPTFIATVPAFTRR